MKHSNFLIVTGSCYKIKPVVTTDNLDITVFTGPEGTGSRLRIQVTFLTRSPAGGRCTESACGRVGPAARYRLPAPPGDAGSVPISQLWEQLLKGGPQPGEVYGGRVEPGPPVPPHHTRVPALTCVPMRPPRNYRYLEIYFFTPKLAVMLPFMARL